MQKRTRNRGPVLCPKPGARKWWQGARRMRVLLRIAPPTTSPLLPGEIGRLLYSVRGSAQSPTQTVRWSPCTDGSIARFLTGSSNRATAPASSTESHRASTCRAGSRCHLGLFWKAPAKVFQCVEVRFAYQLGEGMTSCCSICTYFLR